MDDFYLKSTITKGMYNGFSLIYLSLFLEQHEAKKYFLFKAVVDKLEDLDWFFENEHKIRHIEVPISFGKRLSIAEGLKKIYRNTDIEEDAIFDTLYEYRSTHDISFAFRGQDIPEVFVGKNGNHHEISCICGGKKWHYKINIDSLFNEIYKSKNDYEELSDHNKKTN